MTRSKSTESSQTTELHNCPANSTCTSTRAIINAIAEEKKNSKYAIKLALCFIMMLMIDYIIIRVKNQMLVKRMNKLQYSYCCTVS